jgi:hypothetical protein
MVSHGEAGSARAPGDARRGPPILLRIGGLFVDTPRSAGRTPWFLIVGRRSGAAREVIL